MDLKKRFSEEQIIGFLQQVEAGVQIKELCRQHGFSDASFYNWAGEIWRDVSLRTLLNRQLLKCLKWSV